MADEFKDKSSLAVLLLLIVRLVLFGVVLFACALNVWSSEGGCSGEGGFTSMIFIAIDFVLIS